MKHPRIEVLKRGSNKFIFIDNHLWMWDTPQERRLQKDLADQSFGDVLVAGYGLGILSQYLLKKIQVTSVTTVEKHPEVLEGLKKIVPIYGKIIIDDFYKLSEKKKYDCIIGDIWPDIDPRCLKDYKKFKRKAEKLLKRNGKILAWGKDFFEYLIEKASKKVSKQI